MVAGRSPHFLQPRFLMECCSHCGNGASLSLSSREVTPLFPTIIVQFLLRSVSSKCSSIWCTLALPPISFPNWMSPKADSVGVPMSSSVPWFPYCPLVLPLTRLSLSSTFRKHLTHHGSRGLWCGFLMLVSGAACGASCVISCMARSHKFVVARHSQNPGWTLALLKAESSLHCFSTSSSTASLRLCDKLPPGVRTL